MEVVMLAPWSIWIHGDSLIFNGTQASLAR
jgi:hypothetical protein